MTFDELFDKWKFMIEIDGVRKQTDGSVIHDLQLLIGENGISFSIKTESGFVFFWKDCVYILAGEVKLYRSDMTYTQFVRSVGPGVSVEEYNTIIGCARRIEQAFPKEFIEDLRMLMRED